jgi:hypothetical protein
MYSQMHSLKCVGFAQYNHYHLSELGTSCYTPEIHFPTVASSVDTGHICRSFLHEVPTVLNAIHQLIQWRGATVCRVIGYFEHYFENSQIYANFMSSSLARNVSIC